MIALLHKWLISGVAASATGLMLLAATDGGWPTTGLQPENHDRSALQLSDERSLPRPADVAARQVPLEQATREEQGSAPVPESRQEPVEIQPWAAMAFLESAGDTAYLESVVPSELAKCAGCWASFVGAAGSGRIPVASWTRFAQWAASTEVAGTASLVLNLATALQGQPGAEVLDAAAADVIAELGRDAQGVQALLQAAGRSRLAPALAERATAVLTAHAEQTRAALLVEQPLSAMQGVAALAPFDVLSAAALSGSTAQREALLASLSIDTRAGALAAVIALADHLPRQQTLALGAAFGAAQLSGSRLQDLTRLIDDGIATEPQQAMVRSMLLHAEAAAAAAKVLPKLPG